MYGPTDLVIVWAILSSKKLAYGEQKAFQNMYDDLQQGRIVRLSKDQRSWAEKKYTDFDLHGKVLPPQPPPKKPHGAPAGFPWEGKLPLKPPGKG